MQALRLSLSVSALKTEGCGRDERDGHGLRHYAKRITLLPA
jgi:hypothetical protein